MTNYRCEKCNQTFQHPAKRLEYDNEKDIMVMHPHTEYQVCPYCLSKNYSETVEAQPEKVYVYDLTSGPQTELNKLLAEGYIVVARYSKQYHLEKLKQQNTANGPHQKEAEEVYRKLEAENLQKEAQRLREELKGFMDVP